MLNGRSRDSDISVKMQHCSVPVTSAVFCSLLLSLFYLRSQGCYCSMPGARVPVCYCNQCCYLTRHSEVGSSEKPSLLYNATWTLKMRLPLGLVEYTLLTYGNVVRSDKIEAVSSCDHPATVDQTPSTETNISAVTDQNLCENSTALISYVGLMQTARSCFTEWLTFMCSV